MPIRTRISGPPGTGKTTTLLELVNTLVGKGYDTQSIVFTTFTRAAATEARDRACAKFKVSKDSFPYFRTLHSLCHEFTGSRPVMGAEDWCRIGKDLKIYFTLKSQETDGMGGTRGDALLRITTLAKANCSTLEEQFRLRESHDAYQDISIEELTHFNDYVQRYKEAHGLRDFHDMLEEVLQMDPPTFDVIIGDEAQDFSKQQWKVFDHISTNSREVYYAGDDDQCIHAWAGADVHTFVQRRTATSFVLSQSYRVPQAVHAIAQRVVRQIPPELRVEKDYKPRGAAGTLMVGLSIDDMPLTEGSWFLLARNKVHLDALALCCQQRGVLFSGPVATPGVAEYIRALLDWTKLLSGGPLHREAAINLYDHMSQRDRVERGFKSKLADAPIDGKYTWDILHETFGLRYKGSDPITALDKVDPKLIGYVGGLLKNGESLTAPRVEINTIHGVKGREADHVALCLDMTEKTWRGYQANPDNEHRVFYVGITRAKKSLTLLRPWTNKYYNIPA